MSTRAIETGSHRYEGSGNGNGKRWYDPARMVLVLFAIVGLFIVAWAGFVFNVAYGAAQKNVEQDGALKSMVEQLDVIKKTQDKQDGKLDRILERMPK